MKYNVHEVRSHFSSLESGAVFFDNPGGTQVPVEVISAVKDYYSTSNSNVHGSYATSIRTDRVVASARESIADFINAPSARSVILGPNMTSLTLQLSRALGRRISKEDEIVVTKLDHDANISPWLHMEEKGAKIRWVDINTDDATLDTSSFESCLGPRTKIVAVGYASNAVGTVNDLKSIIAMARDAGAMVFVDAVHYAPHGPVDVQDLGCDFLACSPYKFYGPHTGALYGKPDLLEELKPYKVRPASDDVPEKFETGTLNHEGLKGITAAVDFIASIGEKYGSAFAGRFEGFEGRRLRLKTAMAAINEYERKLFVRLFNGLKDVPGIRIYGITDPDRFVQRTPTAAFTLDAFTPKQTAAYLGDRDIYVWEGNYYALAVMEALGLEGKGGAVRVGLGCYNTEDEVDRFLSAMHDMVS